MLSVTLRARCLQGLRLRWVALSVVLIATRGASATPPTDVPDLAKLAGQTVTIVLKVGRQLKEVEVTKVTTATDGSVKSLTVKVPPNRTQTVMAMTVKEIYIEDEPLDVVFIAKTQSLSHSAERRAARIEKRERMLAQLKAKRAVEWKEYTTEQQEKFIAQQKEFLDKVGEAFSGMTVYETEFFLVCTDMPADQITTYIKMLDSMYKHLGKAFSVPEGKNVWKGKCVVVVFIEAPNFHKFERDIMNNSDSQGAQGLHHGYGDGKVIVSCYRGSDPLFFGSLLVHETSHGFLHRYKSSVHVRSWINEGIAEWTAGAVVTACKETGRRQRMAAEQAKAKGTLGGNFFDEANIDGWQYGVASTIVDMLLKVDGSKYRQMIDDIKDGVDWEDSLQNAFGMTTTELVSRYGQYIGVPHLQP